MFASLVNVKLILNLWAPGAFAFEEPWALSTRDGSSLGVTKLSVIDRPILYDGLAEYLSNTIVCCNTSTAKPFM